MKINLKHIIVISLFLVVSVILTLFVGYPTRKNIEDLVDKENIENILSNKYQEIDTKLNYIEKNILVDSANIDSYFYSDLEGVFDAEGFGFFYYKKNELKYWSTNNIPVPTSTTFSFFDRSQIFLNNGHYLCRVVSGENWQLVGLFQVKKEYSYRNNIIENSFWSDLKLDESISINTDSVVECVKIRYGEESDCFYLIVPEEINDSVFIFGLKHGLLIADFFLAVLFVVFMLTYFCRKFPNWSSLFALFLFVFIFLFRYYLLKYTYFSGFVEFELFSPLLFAESFWLPSLGDYLVNTILLLIFSVFFFFNFKPRIGIRINAFTKLLFSASVAIIMYVSGCYLSDLFYGLVWNSSISFGFENVLNLDIYSFVGTAIIVSLVFSFVLIIYRIIRHFKEILSLYQLLISLVVCSAYGLIIHENSNVSIESFIIFEALFFLLWAILSFIALKRNLTYFLSVIILVLVSLITSEHFSRLSNKKELDAYKVITYNLAAERDVGAEFFLKQSYNEIETDNDLAFAISQKDFAGIENSVNKILLSKRYFNKYETQTTICLSSDSLIIEPDCVSYGCFDFFRDQVDENGMIIPGSNFFFIDNHNGRISYLGEISTKLEDGTYVNIYIELNSKIFSEGLGYPELLLDKKLAVKKNNRNLNYAKYNKGSLISSKGDYKYQFTLKPEESDTAEYSYSVKNGYIHFKYRPDDENLIILSKPDTQYSSELVSFTYILSFLFILFNLIWLLISINGGLLLKGTTLKTKIQISIITILILSLVLTGTISIYFIVQGYKDKQRETVQDKVHSVLIELEHKVGDEKKLNYENSDYLNSLLVKFSNVFYTDINLYDLDGILLSSSRIELYDKGLKGRYMDSEAYRALIVDNSGTVIISERIDNIEYLSVYVPFRNYNNEIIAYLNLPYFARQSEFKEEISNFVVAFSNIFLALILIAVVIGIFISRQLTRPLVVIQDKIKSMDIKKKAEKIVYNRNDELGGLIREYNRKVDELSESALKLAQSEREMAWREMAKQIAHEIKNPLTPMKLSVQYLERAYDLKDENWEKTYRKVNKTLIEQIDVLSGIASEFSNFAKMPTSKKETINLIEIIETTVQLYENTEDVDFNVYNEIKSDGLINADKEQMLRVFTNLIKNCIQAIPDTRVGKIIIKLQEIENNYFIKIIDNGCGIPEEMRTKIFQPNFTTKSAGMGLGLSMVKSMLISNNATIYFETKTDEGTEFIIEIPRL